LTLARIKNLNLNLDLLDQKFPEVQMPVAGQQQLPFVESQP